MTVLVSCSTTSGLPEDEYLYTGIKAIKVDDSQDTDEEAIAMTEVEAALDYAPNNSLFGSSYMRFPLPVGLWIYNSMEGQELKGLKKWFFNTFGATPKTITSAAPDMRSKIATNILQNYGYFQGNVDYELITNKRNPRKQKVRYDVHLGRAYLMDSIRYAFQGVQDSIVTATKEERYIARDKQFSVVDLQSERSRLVSQFHNNGFYFYRPDYIEYYADSVNEPGKVKLLVAPSKSVPDIANRQWKFGRVSAFVRNSGTTGRNFGYSDTVYYRRLNYAYQGKRIPVKSRIMFRNFRFWTGRMYDESRVAQTLTELRNMNIFSNVQFAFTPHDTTDTCSVLDVRLDATLEKKMNLELDFNFTQRSNSQIGPDASLTFSKLNAFHYGETLALTLRGSYYWQTKNRSSEKVNNLDTYQWGVDLSLSYPWLAMPGFLKRRFLFPTSTKFEMSMQRTNIAKACRLNQISFGADYHFQTSKYIKHTFTPLRVELTNIREINREKFTEESWSSIERIYLSENFAPSIQYTFTYDNSIDAHRIVSTNFTGTIKEGGNIINSIYALCGRGFNVESKKLFGLKYNQFVKVRLELRNNFRISQKSSVATRLLAGGMKAYGNSTYAPIAERFYSGGANSIRAFAARSIGPGHLPSTKTDLYLTHGGDIRFEANAEYRFPIFGNLNGALFVDAGNVWDTDDIKADIDEGRFTTKGLLNEIALGTGFGFRYDLEFLVLRLDFGVALHAPYDTGKKGYYNLHKFFKDGTTINFAVGYPF